MHRPTATTPRWMHYCDEWPGHADDRPLSIRPTHVCRYPRTTGSQRAWIKCEREWAWNQQAFIKLMRKNCAIGNEEEIFPPIRHWLAPHPTSIATPMMIGCPFWCVGGSLGWSVGSRAPLTSRGAASEKRCQSESFLCWKLSNYSGMQRMLEMCDFHI